MCKRRCPQCRVACRSNHRGNGGSMNGLEEVGLVPIAPAVHAHMVWVKGGSGSAMNIHAWVRRDDDLKQRFALRQEVKA